ncbi:triple tyrosine motif-containing protein [Sphingobacterium lactis]|uniref:triple tyrosine motif-containing protein n=1 Tax=Sphingobacterium lactis TaxID=797291 RepID=UPI003DA1ED14
MVKYVRFLLLIILFVTGHSAIGQNIPRVGSPFVQQYSKSVYQAGNQNWGLAVSPEGFIYAANTEGLLAFDGQEWKLHPMKNRASLRSVNIDNSGRIFVGGAGEFGYWTRSAYGKMAYTSLTGLVQDQQSLRNEEIWRIIIDGRKIYFHTFSKSYLYENNQITPITADGEPFLFGFQVNDKLYFEQIPSGLHHYANGKLVKVKDADVLKGMNILTILPFMGNDVLIGTANNGIFRMNAQGDITPWQTEASEFLKKYQINNGVKLFGNQYAFGTIQNGVIILNQQGEIVQHISKNNGLQNNTVLSLAVDKQFNLWVGLDNGIDRIDVNSPLYYYADLTGNIGTVYTSIIFDNKIYLGTNQGLFVSDWHGTDQYMSLNFRIVPGSQGQVWKLENINGQLVCGHNNGTFLVENGNLRKISTVTGAWQFLPVTDSPYWLQANYTGIGLMDANNPLRFIKQFSYNKSPVRHMIQRGETEFWLSNNQTVYSFRLRPDLQEAVEFRPETKGLPQNTKLNGIYNLANNIVFASDSGFYLYDNILRSFKPYEELNQQLGSFANANKIIPIRNNAYWFILNSHIARVELKNEGKLKIDSSSWNSLKGKMMNDYEQILNVNDNLSIIGLDNGFALYFDKYPLQQQLPKPIITSVWNTTGEPYPIYDELQIDNKQNNIRIAFASPWYSSAPLKYQYYLEGYTENWSSWDEISFKDFTNLPFGTYTFQVRAMAPNGMQSEISTVTFEIHAPWYFSWPAILIYILILAALVYFLRKWYQHRLLQHQRRLKEKLLAEQEERIAREAAANEKKLISLKNIQLEQELESKNRELANAAMNIVYKNEMLNNLHHELTNLNDSNGNKLSSDQLRKVSKLIDEAHSDDRDWDLFEKSFNEAHENFFKKLKTGYPSLVPNDLKLCAYLRLNMSSKEIASLLNISTRGVEIRRYRLRKKLNLPTEKNLSEFLLEV